MMNDTAITLIPAERVPEMWPLVEPFMEMAAEETNGRYQTPDILNALLNLHHDLWVVYDDLGIKGALVTAIKLYPHKRYLELSFIGGRDGPEWKDQMLGIMRKWAEANSCEGIESCARIGWSRIFKDDGYRPMWQVFELPLKAEGVGE